MRGTREEYEKNTGLNPRALVVQIPAFAGRDNVGGWEWRRGVCPGLEIRVFGRAIVCCADRGEEAVDGKRLYREEPNPVAPRRPFPVREG